MSPTPEEADSEEIRGFLAKAACFQGVAGVFEPRVMQHPSAVRHSLLPCLLRSRLRGARN